MMAAVVVVVVVAAAVAIGLLATHHSPGRPTAASTSTRGGVTSTTASVTSTTGQSTSTSAQPTTTTVPAPSRSESESPRRSPLTLRTRCPALPEAQRRRGNFSGLHRERHDHVEYPTAGAQLRTDLRSSDDELDSATREREHAHLQMVAGHGERSRRIVY